MIRPSDNHLNQKEIIAYKRNLGYTKSSDLGICFAYSILAGQFIATQQQAGFEALILELADNIHDQRTAPSIEVRAMLDCIELIQEPDAYSEWFGTPKAICQSSLIGLPFVASKTGGTKVLPIFTAALTKQELIRYFSSLEACITAQGDNLRHDFTLVLYTGYHAIHISYHDITKTWLLLNADHISTKPLNRQRLPSIQALVDAISRAFKNGDHYDNVFSTRVMYTKASHKQIRAITQQWQEHEFFRITPTKANRTDVNNVSWLLMAISQGANKEVRLLLEQGANIEQRGGRDGKTPLYMAALVGNLTLVGLLLKWRALPNRPRIEDKKTPCIVAAQQGHAAIVELLLAHGANPNLQTSNNGDTALFRAAYDRQPKTVATLLNHHTTNYTLTSQVTSDRNQTRQFTPLEVAQLRAQQYKDRIMEKQRLNANLLNPHSKQRKLDNWSTIIGLLETRQSKSSEIGFFTPAAKTETEETVLADSAIGKWLLA